MALQENMAKIEHFAAQGDNDKYDATRHNLSIIGTLRSGGANV